MMVSSFSAQRRRIRLFLRPLVRPLVHFSWLTALVMLSCLLTGCDRQRAELMSTLTADESLALERLTQDNFSRLFQLRRETDGSLIAVTQHGDSRTIHRLVRDDQANDGIDIQLVQVIDGFGWR